MKGPRAFFAAAFVVAASALALAWQLPPPPPDDGRYAGPHDLCGIIEDGGAHAAAARLVATQVAQRRIDAYLAAATGIPRERSSAIATALRRASADPCHAGVVVRVSPDLRALDETPALPTSREAFACVRGTAHLSAALAAAAFFGTSAPESPVIDVRSVLVLERDGERRFGQTVALRGVLTVSLVSDGAELDRVTRTLTLPDDTVLAEWHAPTEYGIGAPPAEPDEVPYDDQIGRLCREATRVTAEALGLRS